MAYPRGRESGSARESGIRTTALGVSIRLRRSRTRAGGGLCAVSGPRTCVGRRLWEPYAGRYAWRAGYWGRPPYAGAAWVAPRYYGSRFVRGYWRR